MNLKNIKLPSASKLRIPALNLALLGLWLWLYRGVYPYLGTIFTAEEFRTNQVVLAGALLLIGVQIRRGGLRLHLERLPQYYLPALLIALAGSAGYLAIERYLDVNTFAATLFALASYGLLGLWMAPPAWRQGLPAALLLSGALPFGDHLQTFVGYPVRILTAGLVRDGLHAFGVDTVGVDTILIFENGISKVDLPCSGVKSLWTGGLFLLAATWIDRRRVNLRWLLIAVLFAVLLLGANLLRVAVLVSVGQVAGWLFLAEMLHVPLGVLGFAGVCAAGVYLLRFSHPLPVEADAAQADAPQAGAPGTVDAGGQVASQAPPRPAWLPAALAGVVLLMGLVYTPRPQTAAQAEPAWQFPAGLATSDWPLTPGERDWLESAGVDFAERWHFSTAELHGSLLFVTSSSWRSHHRPENCFEVYGWQAETEFTHLVRPDFPVRMLLLGRERSDASVSAAYWLQSAGQTTDDYAARIWADLAPERQPWVLVTVLFDEPIDPRSPQAQELYISLHASVQAYLAGGIDQ